MIYIIKKNSKIKRNSIINSIHYETNTEEILLQSNINLNQVLNQEKNMKANLRILELLKFNKLGKEKQNYF